ncbi:RNA polymerase sigma factor [Kitasatospora sp. NPDC059795]|uniref:RNA polymerase sigma factor n=1 Tax=Kitasatospora sp. NPDC059795 TaxID=3346949 RepID=UPI00364E510E
MTNEITDSGRAGADAPALPVVFEDFYRQSAPKLLAYARHRYQLDGTVAEDLVQEALISIYRRWDEIRNVQSPLAYAYRAVRNRVVDHHRQSHRREIREISADAGDGTNAFEDPMSNIDELLSVTPLIDQLPQRQREILLMSTVYGMTHDEIARALRINPSTVAVHLSAARKRLAQQREQEVQA